MDQMKTLLATLSVALAGVSTANAQYYRPSIVRDTTVVGAVAGALIGGHNNDHWAEGAIIGAAAGALVGAAVDQSQPVVYRSNAIAPVAVVPNAPVVGAPAPAVVYVNQPAPEVVYVDPYPQTVVVGRPIVHFSTGWGYGYPRWGYGHHYSRPVPRGYHWSSRNHYAPHRGDGHGWRGNDRGHDRHRGDRRR